MSITYYTYEKMSFDDFTKPVLENGWAIGEADGRLTITDGENTVFLFCRDADMPIGHICMMTYGANDIGNIDEIHDVFSENDDDWDRLVLAEIEHEF